MTVKDAAADIIQLVFTKGKGKFEQLKESLVNFVCKTLIDPESNIYSYYGAIKCISGLGSQVIKFSLMRSLKTIYENFNKKIEKFIGNNAVLFTMNKSI